jgi:hypothetical protein
MREISTDRAGTFVLEYPAGRMAGIRVHEENWPQMNPDERR